MSVPVHYKDLVAQYGSPEAIPNRVLYDYITDPAVQFALIKRADLGWQTFIETPLVKDVRNRCQCNLWFLGRYFTWDSNPEGAGKSIDLNRITHKTHDPLCGLFVKKDPTKTIEQQDTFCKTRVCLFPRGAMKSTWDVVDVIQWVLCFPEIRILFLTAAPDLSVGLVDAVKGYFVVRAKPNPPSLMNIFFPDFCKDEKDLGAADSFTCPAWERRQIRRVEPTVYATSLGSSMSGFHFEVAKIDDGVDTRNSGSELQCVKVRKNLYTNLKMVMAYGYKDFIGTRYSDEDLYGDQIAKNALGETEVTSGLDSDDPRPWTLTINKTSGVKILVGTGWKVKPDAETKLLNGDIKESDLKEQDYYILFPELLPYKKLKEMQAEDVEAFEAQINQNPRPEVKITFPKALLLKRTLPFRELPLRGPIAITWDFAFSENKRRDFSTAAVGIWDEAARLYIIDLVRDRFDPTALAKAVVDLLERWRPTMCGVENAAGSKLLSPTILAEAKRRENPELVARAATIDWFVPDNTADAKRTRIKTLHPKLMDNTLAFAAHLPQIETIYYEFERCLVGHKHDDIPDVIAQLLRYEPVLQTMIKKQQVATYVSQEQAAWNLIFEPGTDAYGRIGYGQPSLPLVPPPVEKGVEAQSQCKGLDPILGAGLVG